MVTNREPPLELTPKLTYNHGDITFLNKAYTIMARKQVSISLGDQERKLAKEIAKELGWNEATVLSHAATNGLDDLLERIERRKKYLNKDNSTKD